MGAAGDSPPMSSSSSVSSTSLVLTRGLGCRRILGALDGREAVHSVIMAVVIGVGRGLECRGNPSGWIVVFWHREGIGRRGGPSDWIG